MDKAIFRAHPADGSVGLPLLTMSEAAFATNSRAMLNYTRRRGVALAPHAKTAMSVDLARRLLDAGAWGTTVADIRQAGAMLVAGLNRIILANQVGGVASARRLAALLARHPDAELTVFVDSIASLTALTKAWAERSDLPVLGLAVELGAGRAGARTLPEAEIVIEAAIAAAAANDRLRFSGVAAYEAAAIAAGMSAPAAHDAILAVLTLAGNALKLARQRVALDTPLLLSVGGSSYFDLVVDRLQPVVASDPKSTLVLRSGAIFFHDHGIYAGAMSAMARRAVDTPANSFRPALRLWAEVLSRPEPELAICGLGMRDTSFDQGFPLPLQAYRDGRPLAAQPQNWSVSKLNDQHAFVTLNAADLRVGDVIAFGISHPCTCIDHWHAIVGIDDDDRIAAHYPTAFR